MKKEPVEIGIIGGSGFCAFPEIERKRMVSFSGAGNLGFPSDKITIGSYAGKTIAFLPRHGYKHQLPPHLIPYKANIAALKQLGVKYIFAFCVVGSLKKEIKPGDFIVLNQFVNLTWGRDVSFDRNQPFVHLPMADPYSSGLREIVYKEGKKMGLRICKNGTVVVIQGPRFNTKAESIWFSQSGWDVVNMTQYPECYFAKEFGLNYAGIATVTDFDVGLQNYGSSMTKERLTENALIFRKNVRKSKKLIVQILLNWARYKNKIQEPDIDARLFYK